VITDPPPRTARQRGDYERSEALPSVPLPPAAPVRADTEALAAAVAGGELRPVREAAAALLGTLSTFYGVPVPPVAVLGVRPHKVTHGVCTYQLFGDYTPSTQRIRVWMRTAIRAQVSSPRAFLNTLLHEFAHHLDCTRLRCPESFHTRGFYSRIDHLYHLALGTPAEKRRPLHWVKRGAVWHIDWARSRSVPSRPVR
jgi:hypothetical protein